MRRMLGPFPVGVWIALLALLFLLIAWGMQAFSLIDWERAVDLGLQNERFTGNEVELAWALESWGVAVADMIWALPIWVIALIGITRKRTYGFAAGLMEFAIGIYFPLVFSFQRWNLHRETAIIALILWVPMSILGIAGLWMNRSIFIGSE